jgi:D-sedoheptulose 7-phosphate isomerase
MLSRMVEVVVNELEESIATKKQLLEASAELIESAGALVAKAISSGGKVLVCGNGGSAADSQHFAAELVGRFRHNRRALPAISLVTDTSILTAVANDFGYSQVFSRQIEALAHPGDVVICISSSGESESIVLAAESARLNGVKVIALTGKTGGVLVGVSDICIVVPSFDTARIQECHLAVEHIICSIVELHLGLGQ